MSASQTPVRVAISDDYELVVAGVAAVLAPYADRVDVVELDANKPTATAVDVVLYDTFGQDQGANLDVDSLAQVGKPKVVVFSWNVQRELVEGAISAGAAGYLWKGMPADDIVAALEKVHAGEMVTPADDARPDVETGAWPGQEFGLSAREAEIIALITQGLTNQEIADQGLPEHQLDQDLHPQRVPQDGRPTTVPGRRMGPPPRLRTRPRPHTESGSPPRVKTAPGHTTPRTSAALHARPGFRAARGCHCAVNVDPSLRQRTPSVWTSVLSLRKGGVPRGLLLPGLDAAATRNPNHSTRYADHVVPGRRSPSASQGAGGLPPLCCPESSRGHVPTPHGYCAGTG